MIVLNQSQVTWLNQFLSDNKQDMPFGLGVQPIQIKNNKWVLPETVLEDIRLHTLKFKLGRNLEGLEVRAITEEELILIDPSSLFS
jgi:hypothetical protein